MELRHLRYLVAVADSGTFREASRRLHISQSTISEQIADLEYEIGGPLLDRGLRATRLTPQGHLFLAEARTILAAADHALHLTRRALLGQAGSLNIGFFLWGAGSFFASIIRDFRKLYPSVHLTLQEMHTSSQMEALESGKIDIGFTRPIEPPYHLSLRSELLLNDPIVAVLPSDHPLALGPIRLEDLAREPFITSSRAINPPLYDLIIALCSAAGFSPNLVNSSVTWAGVLTLVESGEGIALVPSGVRYLGTPGVVFAELLPNPTAAPEVPPAHVGIAITWNPRNDGPVVQNFLTLIRANKDRIRRTT